MSARRRTDAPRNCLSREQAERLADIACALDAPYARARLVEQAELATALCQELIAGGRAATTDYLRLARALGMLADVVSSDAPEEDMTGAIAMIVARLHGVAWDACVRNGYHDVYQMDGGQRQEATA